MLETITEKQREKLKAILFKSKLEFMDDKKAILIERIKRVIVEMIHYLQDLPKTNFSEFLSNKLSYNYTYLAILFSDTQGTTIEHYINLHKIEKVNPAQYSRLISVTPAANKPGELHRINILVIEIASYLTKHNSRLIKL